MDTLELVCVVDININGSGDLASKECPQGRKSYSRN